VTTRGDLHVKCVAYLVVDLGLEAAFGDLTERERSILLARLRLPNVEEDTEEGLTRYRKVHDAASVAGSYAPEVTDKTSQLFARLRGRVDSGDARTVAVEARRHVQRAAELLSALT
jgi:hypothetical protein